MSEFDKKLDEKLEKILTALPPWTPRLRAF